MYDYLISFGVCPVDQQALAWAYQTGGLSGVVSELEEKCELVGWVFRGVAFKCSQSPEQEPKFELEGDIWVHANGSLADNDLAETNARFGVTCSVADPAHSHYQMYVFYDEDGLTAYDEGSLSEGASYRESPFCKRQLEEAKKRLDIFRANDKAGLVALFGGDNVKVHLPD